MNRKVVISGIVLLALLLFVGASYFLKPKTSQVTPIGQDSSGFPIASSNGARTFQVAAANGEPVLVNDFVHNGETISVPDEPEKYLLAGSLGYCLGDGTCPHGATNEHYYISYDQGSQLFTILLLAEPLRDTRKEAEQFLLQRLGISQAELCSLNYDLGTIVSVNSYFAGTNLGFSFCPNAVELP